MKRDTLALIRATMFVVLVLAFVGCCVVEADLTEPPTTAEPTITATWRPTSPTIEETTEPTAETESPTIATEPPTEPQETEPPTETIPPETEPTSATEQPTEPSTSPTVTETTEPIEETEPPTIATEPPTEPPSEPSGTWQSLGTFSLTAYCPCVKCCGQWALNRPTDANGNPIVYTASGALAISGTTIAVDPRIIPYGSTVKINDHIYIAQDAGGGINGSRIDVYFADHEAACRFGLQTAEVFVKIDPN